MKDEDEDDEGDDGTMTGYRSEDRMKDRMG